QRDRPRRHRLVVVAVMAIERYGPLLCERRVVDYIEESRDDGLADLAFEGLALIVIGQALALQAMTDDLVKQDAGRLLHEDRGAGIRVEDRRALQGVEVAAQALDRRGEPVLVGELGLAGAVDAARVLEDDAVVGPGHAVEMHAVDRPLAG